jgi:hypothetical protein
LTSNGGFYRRLRRENRPGWVHASLTPASLGGAGSDVGLGISVDTAGNAYITGYTDSPADTFPVLVGPGIYQNGGRDAFVAKVSSEGSPRLCGIHWRESG